MDTRRSIVVATPHDRHDGLVARLIGRGYDVHRLRRPADLTAEVLASVAPRYCFFPHWSWIVPAQVYEAFECVIFHMTDLPYGRGGSPLQNLIVRGHDSTMITALRCVAAMDAGPVYLKRPLSLGGTAEEILVRAGDIIEGMILDILELNPAPRPQTGEPVLFRRRSPEDGEVSNLVDLASLYDHIRMLDADGYPPAHVATEHLMFELRGARWEGDHLVATVRVGRR